MQSETKPRQDSIVSDEPQFPVAFSDYLLTKWSSLELRVKQVLLNKYLEVKGNVLVSESLSNETRNKIE